MKKYNVLIGGAGSGGGNNLVRSLKQCEIPMNVIGSNIDKYETWRSNADRTYLLPRAISDNYISELNDLINAENIDLIIVSNIEEMEVVSEKRELINTAVFLPHDKIMKVCNDKIDTHKLFEKNNIPCSKFKKLSSLDDIYRFTKANPADRYWIRAARGAGSIAATWVNTPEQAKSWLDLWIQMRGMSWSDFMIEEFLPGKDYALQSVWKDGELQVCKMIQRLEYVHMKNTLSGSSSSPTVALTLKNDEVIATALRAVKILSELTDGKPNGNYSMDFKEDKNGVPFITEINIGRFCMITPIFDFTGKINTAGMHVACALGLETIKHNPIDIEEGVYLVRGLDMEPKVVRPGVI